MATIAESRTNLDELRRYFIGQKGYTESDFERVVEDATRIYGYCLQPGTNGRANGLLYGHVQSGKTGVIITTIALAMDNGYNNFIILTTDLNDLYAQTLERVQEALHGAQVIGKRQFKPEMTASGNGPLVLVASKNATVMSRLLPLIERLRRQNESFMIIDDEADQASLNTNTNKPTAPASGVNAQFQSLFAQLPSFTFLQTTATPEALLLQDEATIFKPNFVVAARPGAGYVGGNYFFDADRTGPHTRVVDAIDVQNLRTSNVLPASVAQSIYVFLTGAAILRLKGSNKNYTYLLHSSLKQADHSLAFGLINGFVGELRGSLSSAGSPNQAIMQGIEAAYADLSGGFDEMPIIGEVVAEIKSKIPSTDIFEINAQTGAGVHPNPPRRHTLYIGGAKIGRGVTVANLIVTYYGRDAKNPQVDTVLQHARMYGYRKDDLPAIRIFLPWSLEARFIDIHETDNSIRDLCQETGMAVPVIPLGPRMKPTRTNVLNAETVSIRAYVGGHKYFPMLPVSEPEELGDQTAELDALLSEARFPQTQKPYPVSIDEMLTILGFKFGTLDSPGAWNDRLIRDSIRSLRERCDNQASLVVVNRASDLTKNRHDRWLGAVLPGNLPALPYGVPKEQPALFMTRLTGAVAPPRGWHGVPFWVPVVRFPSGNYAVAVNRS